MLQKRALVLPETACRLLSHQWRLLRTKHLSSGKKVPVFLLVFSRLQLSTVQESLP